MTILGNPKFYFWIWDVGKYWLKVENTGYFQEIMKTLFTNLIMRGGKLEIQPTKLGKILYEKQDCPGWWAQKDLNL